MCLHFRTAVIQVPAFSFFFEDYLERKLLGSKVQNPASFPDTASSLVYKLLILAVFIIIIIIDFILGFAHHETNCKIVMGRDLWSLGNNSYEFFKIVKGMVSIHPTWCIGQYSLWVHTVSGISDLVVRDDYAPQLCSFAVQVNTVTGRKWDIKSYM